MISIRLVRSDAIWTPKMDWTSSPIDIYWTFAGSTDRKSMVHDFFIFSSSPLLCPLLNWANVFISSTQRNLRGTSCPRIITVTHEYPCTISVTDGISEAPGVRELFPWLTDIRGLLPWSTESQRHLVSVNYFRDPRNLRGPWCPWIISVTHGIS